MARPHPTSRACDEAGAGGHRLSTTSGAHRGAPSDVARTRRRAGERTHHLAAPPERPRGTDTHPEPKRRTLMKQIVVIVCAALVASVGVTGCRARRRPPEAGVDGVQGRAAAAELGHRQACRLVTGRRSSASSSVRSSLTSCSSWRPASTPTSPRGRGRCLPCAPPAALAGAWKGAVRPPDRVCRLQRVGPRRHIGPVRRLRRRVTSESPGDPGDRVRRVRGRGRSRRGHAEDRGVDRGPNSTFVSTGGSSS